MIKLENDDLIEYIRTCNEQLRPESKLLYEVSFFKIFVKFEKFLSEMFIRYSIGEKSSHNYLPERKLNFIDEEHLRAVLSDGNKSYIDYRSKIEKLGKHIFRRNPFNVIFEESINSTLFYEMECMRNYIAHESEESKRKYKNACLNNNEFIDVGEYLLKINRRKSKTNYTIYIEKIIEISNLLLDPPDIDG